MTGLGAIEKLRKDHEVDSFDCGIEALNRFLRQHAWANQRSNASQTYVVAEGKRVRGYYSLAAGSVSHDAAPRRVAAGQARHPISVVLLAHLAVDESLVKKKGVGAALLKDALVRVSPAADIVGARALLAHALGASRANLRFRRFVGRLREKVRTCVVPRRSRDDDFAGDRILCSRNGSRHRTLVQHALIRHGRSY